MNKQRRSTLKGVVVALRGLQASMEETPTIENFKLYQSALTMAGTVLQDCLDEEQEYYDKMPEGIQMGERGERAANAIDGLENAISAFDYLCGLGEEEMGEVSESINSVIYNIEEATN